MRLTIRGSISPAVNVHNGTPSFSHSSLSMTAAQVRHICDRLATALNQPVNP